MLVSATTQESWYRIELDPREPFLNDHRPGGAPLLGTVMSIEALACAVTLAAGGYVSTISNVRIGMPYILHDESTPHAASICITRHRADRYGCALLTRVPGQADITHLEATFELAPGLLRHSLTLNHRFEMPEDGAVTGGDIYRCFFHGPSFQVIKSARLQDRSMLSRLAPGLPASRRHIANSCMSPRLVEFGLQTAGLLELACSGRMMIPYAIERVERITGLDVDTEKPLYAFASYDAEFADSIDVDIADAHGNVVMQIQRYRTVPLPFPADQSSLARLAAAFHSLPQQQARLR